MIQYLVTESVRFCNKYRYGVPGCHLVVLHPNSTAVGVPARIVRKDGVRVCGEMDQIHVKDPVSQELCRLRGEVEALAKELTALKAAQDEKKGESEK